MSKNETMPVLFRALGAAAAILATGASPAWAAITCERNVSADIVAFDMPLMYNRLGASNVNSGMFALKRDVIDKANKLPLTAGGTATPGNVELRPDKRPRPLVLRVRTGDCLTVNLTNLLTPTPNLKDVPLVTEAGQQFTVFIDDTIASRVVGFNVAGVQLVNSIDDDGSMVGKNHLGVTGSKGTTDRATGGQAAPGQTRSYTLYAEKEGVFVVGAGGATVGNDSNQGHSGSGLFGELIVEPKGARIYRGQLHEEEMRLATAGTTTAGQPKINYEASYPTTGIWVAEGKAGLPILNMMQCAGTACQIVHSEINAVIAGPNPDGSFPPDTYPLERTGKRNPTLPNRLEPFRDFASIFHDEPATAQAFPGFYVTDPVFSYVLAGVKDGFMINYGSGGIGSEIIANRLGVGPMHDCLSCSYEEFFLTSFAVGDPGLIVDIPANLGLEALLPGQAPPAGTTGPKANYVIGAEDPANVHMSYTGDFAKFRNIHVGKEQHVFHLHNHQWLYNPNDDNSNYLDAQGIGPGVGYTYEINFGGSGNRNKSAGDAIFHCHFYPHFAQGMWYHWRHLDTFETGTKLAASGAGYHTALWGLANTTPAIGARAYPDGEIARGVAIPAVVPLPGKPLPVMPGEVTVVAKIGANGAVLGSNAKVIDRTKNPGYPFWIAGIEDVVGQRPPSPVLDMLTSAQAAALKATGGALWANIDPAQAAGFDGGLPRHALLGYSDGGLAAVTVNNLDFTKTIEVAKPVYYPEEGTDLEKVAMAFHALRAHPTVKVAMDGGAETSTSFITNGQLPAVGAPYHEPCADDTGVRLGAGVLGTFFGGASRTDMSTRGASVFNAQTPRIYKGANIQFDAILNKAGYHYPQQRIIALWEDAGPVIAKTQPPEPLVMRLNTFDCAVFHHTNLVPEYYELDDFQVRTPTDIIGQHIHLPKWDLTTTDGAANGWNYEDGTFSPGAVRERIHAIRAFNGCTATDGRNNTPACPVEQDHPYFGSVAAKLGGRFPEVWKGARTTMQRWFADPVVNALGVDRGLGIIFTHDHYGPSSHQQIGLYATVLAEPAGSTWVQNETGTGLGCTTGVNTTQPAGTTAPNTAPCRWDGGPTSWQAAILPPATAPLGSNVKSETVTAHREFYFEYSDFQHAYEAGVYVGADARGLPTPAAIVVNPANPALATAPALANTFRQAINPPARQQITPLYPDLAIEVAGGIIPGCPTRPCPQAISVQDPGVMVVNYRQEPVGLRVFDPAKTGPDGKAGAQADGVAGDLAYALSSKLVDKAGVVTPIVRKIAALNKTEQELGFWGKTLNAPTATEGGDPFTPMMRAYTGDLIRVKIQAGGHEEEHNATIHGVKWLQAGSGFGRAPNSGWRNAQAAGISEQFTFSAPVVPAVQQVKNGGIKDHAYSVDTSMDGWWSGMWGIARHYDVARADLYPLPTNANPKAPNIVNKAEFEGVCPVNTAASPRRNYGVVAMLANDLLPNPGVTLNYGNSTQHNGAALNPNGGTLVYNPRSTAIPVTTLPADGGGTITLGGHAGPLHDPTAMLYVRLEDLVPVNPSDRACKTAKDGTPGTVSPSCPVKLKPGLKVEPLILRAAAGDCVQVTVYNRLPQIAPDLPTLGTLQGVVKRDRNRAEGSVTFDNNLIRASSTVGLHTQLLTMDVTQDDGANVGQNIVQTVSPIDPATGKAGKAAIYRWYAGDVSSKPSGGGVALVATPVEFGAVSLIPADRVKQGQKSLVGTLVIVPQGATIVEDPNQHAQATITPPGGAPYRDFALVLTKDQNHRYADGFPVEHMNGEGVGLPEDSQENSAMALNYGIEPLWFRLGVAPNAPFGGAGCGPGCYGGVPNAHQAYSNVLTADLDPATPVFIATAGQEARIHVTVPHTTSRGSTLGIAGHVWQRDPYRCNGEAMYGLDGMCTSVATGSQSDAAGNPLVGSRNIGNNPIGFAQGGQESLTGYTHFTFRLPKAGGENGVKGDYLFRDKASFGNASGLWGILRVD